MTVTTVQVGTCKECNGTAEIPHTMAGQDHPCFRCNGHGVVKKSDRYHGYRTAQTAATAVKRGYGTTCGECKGSGTGTFALTTRCYSCREGRVILSALPGQSWGDAGRSLRYESGRREVMRAFMDAVDIHITAQNRPGTWNESYLGVGSLSSVTDYGRTWDALGAGVLADDLPGAIETLREKIRASVTDTQWLNLIRSDDTMAEVLIVTVHRNGYTIRGADVDYRAPSLPPTYTPALLDAPVG